MCHQPPPHPKTQHPAPKLQPQVHHTNLPPLPSRGMHPPSLQPPPIPQTTAFAHPTHSPHPNSAPCEGSTRLHECVSDLECCTQPAQDPVHLGEGGGGSWAPGAEPCVWDTSALPTANPQETHRMAAKALDGECICPRAPRSHPKCPATHTHSSPQATAGQPCGSQPQRGRPRDA